MKKIVLIILIVLLIVIGYFAVFYYQKVNRLDASTAESAQKSLDDILAKVGKLILLPTGEIPTIATVTDLSKLKDQPFFAKAKVGDKVIMYPRAKKAYLYDEVNNKILEVAPIDLGPEQQPSEVSNQTPTKTTTTKTSVKK